MMHKTILTDQEMYLILSALEAHMELIKRLPERVKPYQKLFDRLENIFEDRVEN